MLRLQSKKDTKRQEKCLASHSRLLKPTPSTETLSESTLPTSLKLVRRHRSLQISIPCLQAGPHATRDLELCMLLTRQKIHQSSCQTKLTVKRLAILRTLPQKKPTKSSIGPFLASKDAEKPATKHLRCLNFCRQKASTSQPIFLTYIAKRQIKSHTSTLIDKSVIHYFFVPSNSSKKIVTSTYPPITSRSHSSAQYRSLSATNPTKNDSQTDISRRLPLGNSCSCPEIFQNFLPNLATYMRRKYYFSPITLVRLSSLIIK